MNIGDLRDGDALDDRLSRIARDHARVLRQERIVLYAGASLLSRAQRDHREPDLSAMPAMGPHGWKEQPGAGTVDRLEKMASDLACGMFGAAWADLRLPSCTMANLALFTFLTRPGDTMLGPAAMDGGHLSQRRGGTPGLVGLDVDDLPFDADRQCLDAEAAEKQVLTRRPRVVMLGRSVILAPDRLEGVAAAARDIGATTIYDASHVAGLIAAKVFDDPFAAGVDVIVSSTYKTLRGPSGGMVLFRDEPTGRAFSRHLDACFLANQDASRLPAMISALYSCRPESDYGRNVLRLAEALKGVFKARGFETLRPQDPAASHQVVVPVGSAERARSAMQSLESGGLLVGTCVIPGRPGQHGLRFGSQVLASIGMTKQACTSVAELACDLMIEDRASQGLLPASHPIVESSLARVGSLLRMTGDVSA